jgi:hypothetical protein
MSVMICDVYMWYLLNIFCVVWMEYKKQIKKVCTGHFAECDTWQRGILPSERIIALGKEPRSGHQYRFFAECSGPGTRQRATLCRVLYKALDKEPDIGTRWRILSECWPTDTRQRRSLRHPDAVTAAFLCRVLPGTRQSLLPSASDTRQSRRFR